MKKIEFNKENFKNVIVGIKNKFKSGFLVIEDILSSIDDNRKILILRYIIISCVISSLLMLLFLIPFGLFFEGYTLFFVSFDVAIIFLILSLIFLLLAIFSYYKAGKIVDRIKKDENKELYFDDMVEVDNKSE